jgi:biopolymer transport protein ExbD
MRANRTRTNDSTFDLNLAPILDIIVSIIPMLLLSVAFVQVKMLEAPTPQVVAEDKAQTPPKPEATIALKISKKLGFVFEVTDIKGKIKEVKIENKNGAFDLSGLQMAAISLKEQNPQVKQLQLRPDADISFNEIVDTMDNVRLKFKARAKVSLTDALNAKPVANEDLFPNVVFSSVGG